MQRCDWASGGTTFRHMSPLTIIGCRKTMGVPSPHSR
jgi:hypothetical protein